MEKPFRPSGVIILAILAVLFALISLDGAGSFILLGFTQGWLGVSLLGLVSLCFGIVAFVVGLGFLNARPWSRNLGIIVALMALFDGLLVVNFGDAGLPVSVSISFPGLFSGIPISIMMLYFLTRYEVQAYLST